MGRKPLNKSVSKSSSNLQEKKSEAVKNALELINKQFGEGAIMKMGDKQGKIHKKRKWLKETESTILTIVNDKLNGRVGNC